MGNGPARAPFTDVVPLPGGGLVARTPVRDLLVEDAAAARLVERLWPLLDGSRSVDDLSKTIGEDVSGVVADLEASGVVVSGALPPAPRTDKTVGVVGGGDLACRVTEILESLGVHVHASHDAREADLLLAAPDRADPALSDALNAKALDARVPALFVEPIGLRVFVGPFVRPGQSACWTCRELRAWGNAPSAETWDALRARDHANANVPRAWTTAHAELLAGIVASEAVRYFEKGSGAFENAELEVNLEDLTFTRGTLHRVPGCPACGASRA